MSFTENQFSAWMPAWTAAVAEAPGWHDVLQYRGVSALDAGYTDLYFGLLARLRCCLDARERALALEAADAQHSWRVRRVGARLRSGELKPVAAARLAMQRARDRRLMRMPAEDLPAFSGARTALVIAAAPNPTGFPVLTSLRDDFGWRLLFASWSRNAAGHVRATDVPYLHLADTYRRDYVTLRQRHETSVDAEISKLDAREPERLLQSIGGIDVSVEAAPLLRHVCVETRVHTDLYFDLFERVSPTMLLLFNENSLRERPAARVAAMLGIKSVAIQHGLFIGHVYRSLATDRMIVWGRTPREFWLARGASPNQVDSVGAFGHESWHPLLPCLTRTSGADVLFLGQNPAAFIARAVHRASIDIVMDAAKRLPATRFVVRPHPGESVGPYQQAIRENAVTNVTVQRNGDVASALAEAGAVLTVFSTAGLEAMLLRRPVVVLNPSAEPPLAPFASRAPVVSDGASLASVVARIFTDTNYREGLVASGYDHAVDYLGAIEGAAKRGAAIIDSFAANNNGDRRATGS